MKKLFAGLFVLIAIMLSGCAENVGDAAPTYAPPTERYNYYEENLDLLELPCTIYSDDNGLELNGENEYLCPSPNIADDPITPAEPPLEEGNITPMDISEILTTYIEDERVRNVFLDVLLGEQDFINRNTEFETYNNISRWGDDVLKYMRFAVVDMDGDDMLEIVIGSTGDGGVHVLNYYNGYVYGLFLKNFIAGLRANGEFQSFPGLIYDLRQISFEQNNVQHILLARREWVRGDEYIFFVNDMPVTEDEFNVRMELHQSVEYVVWHSLR